MKLQKNWFYNLSISLALIGMLYILISGVSSFGTGKEYPHYLKGLVMIGILLTWMILRIFAGIYARFQLAKKFSEDKKWVRICEAIIVIVVIVAAIIIRIVTIQILPVRQVSDFKTYYEVAVLLMKGTLQTQGSGYCDFIAMFPHIIGYSYILNLAFTWFGESVLVGQYLNVFFSVATLFVTYKIGRKLGKRIGGFITLIVSAFWPSQIIYINMLSAEYSFTFFLFLCIWLFLSLVMDYNETSKKAVIAVLLHVMLGLLLAITAAIRPMATILLIAFGIFLIPQKMKLTNIDRNSIPLVIRVLEKGWLRFIIILISYLFLSGFISTNVEVTINRTLPPSSASFGYYLLLGLNTETTGGWNKTDSTFLYDTLKMTNSATQAQVACRDLAFLRLKMSPKALINLLINKYELLWANDNYAFDWNYYSTGSELPQASLDHLYALNDLNNIMYLTIVGFSLLIIIRLWNKKATYSYILILLYLGTVATHLLIENQNRYHFFIIQVFIILSALRIYYLFKDEQERSKTMLIKKQSKQEEIKKNKEALNRLEEEKTRETKRRMDAMAHNFDMLAALKNGNIIMTVTESYADTNKTYENSETDKNSKMLPADRMEVAATVESEEEMQLIKASLMDDAAAEDNLADAVAEDNRIDGAAEGKADGVAEDNRPDAVAEDSKAEAVVEDNRPDGVAEDNMADSVAEDNKAEAVAENNRVAAMVEDNRPEAVVEDSLVDDLQIEEIEIEIKHKTDLFEEGTKNKSEQYESIRKKLLLEKEILLARMKEFDDSSANKNNKTQKGRNS